MDINELQGLLSTLRTPGALSDMADVNQMIQAGNGQARQDALSSGLIGAGAGLLGYDKRLGPAAGLGSALNGFNQAYNTEMVANRPKVTPLADGAFSQITFPDGTVQIVGNKDVAKFLEAKYGNQAASKLANTVAGAQAGVDAAKQKQDYKTASEFRPMLSSSQSLLDQYDRAMEIVGGKKDAEGKQLTEGQGYKAQVQGLFPGIAGAIGGSEVANNKLLQSLAVDETLLNTAKTKGAISDKEMALFKSPIPALTDDRETVWKPWLKERRAVLEKLSKFYESEVARGESAPVSTGGKQPTQSSSGVDQATVEGYGVKFDPNLVYRIGPNGELQSKAR